MCCPITSSTCTSAGKSLDSDHKFSGPWPGQSVQWFQQKLPFLCKQQSLVLQGFRLVSQLGLQEGCKGLAAGVQVPAMPDHPSVQFVSSKDSAPALHY